jgi:lipopolysaccharide export system permease protein
VLNDAVISAPGQATRNVTAYMLATSLTPEQAAAVNTPPQSTPFWSLSEVADNTADAGLDATAYRLQYQALVSRPVLLVAMVLLAAAFSLRFSRMGGVGTTLSYGVASGFVLYIGTKVLSDLGGAGLISPFVAAWSPAIVGVMIGALILLYQEDG